MKKFLSKSLLVNLKMVATLFVVCVLAISCSQDKPKVKQNFKLDLNMTFRYAPSAPDPIIVDGTSYIKLGYFAVEGEGTGTLLGPVHSFATVLNYGTSPEAPPAGGIGAPVLNMPSYPVTGGPLPLIQAGDFSALPNVLAAFHVPAEVDGHVVNLVAYNKKGDALFLSNIPGTGTSEFISPIKGGFGNKTLIVGGAGKFAHAIGELDNAGIINFIAPYNGTDTYEGWISY